ncbi:somatostatin-1 [Aplochiton taeniatus]
MMCSQLQMMLVALSASVLLTRANAAPRRDVLRELLRADVTQGNEDLTSLLLLKLVTDLVASEENEVLPELIGIGEESSLKEAVARRQLPLSQRERKAGCRNFFWKTFTSC